MSWSEVQRPLPDLIAVRATATEFLAVPVDPHAAAFVDALTVARPNARRPNPLNELRDRLTGLRQSAWELQDLGTVSVETLTAIAAAAITWHRAIVRRTTCQGCSDQAITGLEGSTAQSLQALAAWRAVRVCLGQLVTLAAADPDVHRDARALVGLLHRLSRPEAVITATQADAGRPFLTDDTLSLGGIVFAQVAAFNRATVENLAASDQIWMPARLLTGAEVTDHPDLAAAKLRRGYVHVRPDRLNRLLAAYARATTLQCRVNAAPR